MDAAEILSIGEGGALSLFPGPKSSIKKRFRELAQRWHPDVSRHPDAAVVFAHINRLHDIATGRASATHAKGVSGNRKTWKLADGGEIAVKPLARHAGPLGEIIVTTKTVAYEAISGFEDVADAEASTVGSFLFGSDAMKESTRHFLPVLTRRIDAVGLKVNVFRRPADTVLLRDLLSHLGGRMKPEHVAWIISSMENMACYLQWSGLSHGAISTDNILVSPSMHSIVLVGGWGYATRLGSRPGVLPERTLSLVPRMAQRGETSDAVIDLNLLRATALELLGTSGSGGLALMKDVPEPMRFWLSLPPADSAYADYASWERCLTESFGPRKFVALEVAPADVYPAN